MTHDELLAKIDGTGFTYGEDYVWKVDGKQVKKGTNALRAVVELHKCSHPRFDLLCDCGKAYPCPTIQAIEEQLK